MQRLLSTNLQRKVAILEKFNETSLPIPGEQLCEELNCTMRTLKLDLDEIEAYDPVECVSHESGGFQVIYKNQANYEAAINVILSQSSSLKIIETIFLHEQLTIEELADLVFLSPATVYRRIGLIIDVLNKTEEFTVLRKLCEITGDEYMIRAFFTHLFRIKYNYFEWPFEDYFGREDFEDFINEFLDEIEIDIDFGYFRVIVFICAVHAIRFKQGYRLNSQFEHDKDERFEKISKAKHLNERYADKLGIEITNEFVSEFTSDFSNEMVFFNSHAFTEKAQFHAITSKSFFNINHMINRVQLKFNLKLENQNVFITNLHNTAFLSPKENYIKPVIVDMMSKYNNDLKDTFPGLYEFVRAEVTNYLKIVFGKVDYHLLNSMVYSLLTQWKDLYSQLKESRSKINILLISNVDFLHALMLKDMLSYKSPNNVFYHVYRDVKVDLNELVSSDYDLIITTFHTEHMDHEKLLCIQNIPSDRDLNVLFKTIAKIDRQNRK